ncbi:MAG: MqnA/MqnD/SBP family protein, partial [Thermodesulfobacteriota bacterium]
MIKLGSVSFMNAKPLTFAIENGLVKHDFEIKLTPPSDLSAMLSRKEIDIGLIPVAEFLKRKRYTAIPDISISSYGKVDSVVLLARGRLEDIQRVAVDRR